MNSRACRFVPDFNSELIELVADPKRAAGGPRRSGLKATGRQFFTSIFRRTSMSSEFDFIEGNRTATAKRSQSSSRFRFEQKLESFCGKPHSSRHLKCECASGLGRGATANLSERFPFAREV